MKTSTIAVSLGLALGLAAWVSFTNFGGESSVAPGMAGETQTETAALQPRRSVWHAPLDPQVAMPPAAGFAARVQVSGRVVGPRDEPIHSATIRLRTVGISTGGDEATATEPDGSFVLYRTPGRSAWLTVRADGYLDPPDRPLRVDDDGPLEIRLDAEPTVWGLVVAADTQRVLEAAVVTIIPDPDRRFAHEARVLRGAEAAAHLGQAPAPGLWASAGCGATALIVRARSDGHATTEFRVDDLRAGELRRADLVLEREVPGRGRVVDRDGSPIDGAHVALEFVLGGEEDRRSDDAESALLTGGLGALDPEGGAVPGRPLSRHVFATDAEGRFVILGVGSGRWRMQATHTDHLPATEREIELNDGFEADLDEFRLAPAAAISGQVRDGQGLPVAGAWLSLEASAPGQSDDESLAGSAEDLLSTTSDAEGRFHFSGLRPGTYTLECEGEAGSARLEALPLAEGKNDSLAIRLER